VSEIVIVPTFNREELLYLCLEAIRREDSLVPISVYSDRGATSEDLVTTCVQFESLCNIRTKHNLYGNSFNLISACRNEINSVNGDIKIVHLIEDDTIIHRGYFSWVREQLATKQYAAVCGRIDSPHLPNWMESPAISWDAECLAVALGHFIPEYFTQTRNEMQRVLDEVMFPNSKYRHGGAEQDGAFLRVIEFYGWKTKFPATPLATHLGWWGYNSPPGREKPSGSFVDRVAQCRAMLMNREQRKHLFGHRITDAEMSGWDGR
jgi:hypothetical protein